MGEIRFFKGNKLIYKKHNTDYFKEKKRLESEYSLELEREEDHIISIKQPKKAPRNIFYRFSYYKNDYRIGIAIYGGINITYQPNSNPQLRNNNN